MLLLSLLGTRFTKKVPCYLGIKQCIAYPFKKHAEADTIMCKAHLELRKQTCLQSWLKPMDMKKKWLYDFDTNIGRYLSIDKFIMSLNFGKQ